jgi:uncharacterized protein YggE
MKFAIMVFLAVLAIATPVLADRDALLRTITVTGQAEVMVVPDEVVVNLGVESFQLELEGAKAENDRIVSAVIAAVKKAGVSNDNLRTDYLYIQPRYRETSEERVLLGYIVRQSIIVIVKEMSTFEDIVSAALEEGANQVHGLEFRTSSLREHKDEARAQALDASKEKAEAMAARLGETIGRALTITEEPVAAVFPGASNVMRFGGGGAGEAGGTLAAGRIAITAKVSVKFELLE